ncbi:MAG: ABC-type transport auxiliary lipoprotein family protein [Gammaproteobacteria bacterium]
MVKISLVAALVIALCTGCGTALKDKQLLATYDFGLPGQIISDNTTRAIKTRLEVNAVTAPSWLDSPAILYRLAYQDAARLQPYADSRWAASPAALMTLRLRQAIDALGPPATGSAKQYELRVTLEEFSQIFDASDSSRVLLRANAKLINDDDRSTLAERTFAIEHKARTPDAQGAVSALTQASDDFITELLAWIADLPSIKN